MTPLLQQAFTTLAALPADEQDAVAAWLMDELAAEDAFDRDVTATGDRLAGLATQALAEHRAGETLPLDAESL